MHSRLKSVALVDTLMTKIAHKWKKSLKIILILCWDAVGQRGCAHICIFEEICTWMPFASAKTFPDSLSYLRLSSLYLPHTTGSRQQENRDNIFINAQSVCSFLLPTSRSIISHMARRWTLWFQEIAHNHMGQQVGLLSITDLSFIWMLKKLLRIFLSLMTTIFFGKEIYNLSV